MLFSLYMETFSYLELIGREKVGVAIADSETKMAFSLATFSNDAKLLDAGEIIRARTVRDIVIGIPSHEP